MMRPRRGREKPIERQAGAEELSRVPGEEGGRRAAHTRHLVAVESPTVCGGGVRGSRPGVREEQMVRRRVWEGGPAAANSPGRRPHHHHGDGGRRNAPSLKLFQDLATSPRLPREDLSLDYTPQGPLHPTFLLANGF